MKISNPFVFQQLTSSVVEVEKGGLSAQSETLGDCVKILIFAS